MKIYDKKKKRDEDFDVDLTNIKKHNSENLINDVKNAIEQLPYKFSSLLTLKYVLGYSGKEIAEITGLTETYDGNGNHLKNIYRSGAKRYKKENR